MKRIIHWLGLAACIILIIVCFMPWTFHADVNKNFTGFFSEGNQYGRPGIFLVFFATLIGVFILLPKIWAKRINLFLGAVQLAYALKSYILYTGCYMAYCPEKKAGIFLMLLSTIVIFIACVFPTMRLGEEKN